MPRLMPIAIAITGPIAVGKTALAKNLESAAGVYLYLSTSGHIESLFDRGDDVSRADKILRGNQLDDDTDGEWVADLVSEWLGGKPTHDAISGVIIDAPRQARQIRHLRRRFGSGLVHIHLGAPEHTCVARMAERGDDPSEWREDYSPELAAMADLFIDTNHVTPIGVLLIAAGRVFGGRLSDPRVDVLVGGQFGSEGKGHIASYLAPRYRALARGGGPNAGHQVWHPYGVFTFHSIPSGALHCPDSYLLIGPGAIINAAKFAEELESSGINPDRVVLDPAVTLIDHRDIEAEERLAKAIGSTAQGVGVATARRALRTNADYEIARAGDMIDAYGLFKTIVRPVATALAQLYARGAPILAEGTQGSGLSLFGPHYPYCTSRDTNAAAVISEIGIPPGRVRDIIMVVRTHPIRVQSPDGGTSGEMIGETTWDTVAETSGVPVERLIESERTSTTKRLRRVSHFDWELLHHSVLVNKPTKIALTFADYLSPHNRGARRFSALTTETRRMIEAIELVAECPVSYVSTGFGPGTVLER